MVGQKFLKFLGCFHSGSRSWSIDTTRQWIGLFVSVALANGGVLWLLLKG